MVPHVALVRSYIWTHSVLPRKNERRTRLRYAHVPKPNSASVVAEVCGTANENRRDGERRWEARRLVRAEERETNGHSAGRIKMFGWSRMRRGSDSTFDSGGRRRRRSSSLPEERRPRVVPRTFARRRATGQEPTCQIEACRRHCTCARWEVTSCTGADHAWIYLER